MEEEKKRIQEVQMQGFVWTFRFGRFDGEVQGLGESVQTKISA